MFVFCVWLYRQHNLEKAYFGSGSRIVRLAYSRHWLGIWLLAPNARTVCCSFDLFYLFCIGGHNLLLCLPSPAAVYLHVDLLVHISHVVYATAISLSFVIVLILFNYNCTLVFIPYIYSFSICTLANVSSVVNFLHLFFLVPTC